MSDSSSILIEKLALFAGALRDQGLTIGLGEVMDAAQTLEKIGFEDRQTVKYALSAIMAKSEYERDVFAQAFDRFFVPAEKLEKAQKAAEEVRSQRQTQRSAAEEELQYQGKSLEMRDHFKDLYAQLPADTRKSLQRKMEFYAGNPRAPLNPMAMRHMMEKWLIMEDMGAMPEDLEEPVQDILRKDISDITPAEIPTAIRLTKQLIDQINGRASARRRRAGRSRKLDFRKTIRLSLQTGGSFHKLKYKKRHQKKKQLILLCDVSGSMLRYSAFTIHFLKSMSDAAGRAKTYLFSSAFTSVEPAAMTDAAYFDNYVKTSGLWGKGTNIGFALEQLLEVRPALLGSSSVLIILSDTKTTDIPRAEAALQRVARQTGKVLWLNPLEEKIWNTVPTISLFKKHCQMLPCSTIRELAAACARYLA